VSGVNIYRIDAPNVFTRIFDSTTLPQPASATAVGIVPSSNTVVFSYLNGTTGVIAESNGTSFLLGGSKLAMGPISVASNGRILSSYLSNIPGGPEIDFFDSGTPSHAPGLAAPTNASANFTSYATGNDINASGTVIYHGFSPASGGVFPAWRDVELSD